MIQKLLQLTANVSAKAARSVHITFRSLSAGVLGVAVLATAARVHAAWPSLAMPTLQAGWEATGPDGFGAASGIVTDPATGKVFVSDNMLNRILRFSSQQALTNGGSAEYVFGAPSVYQIASGASLNRFAGAYGMCIDGSGRLWVCDYLNNRVLRFDNAATRTDIEPSADGVLGEPDPNVPGAPTAYFNIPHHVAASPDGKIWVADAFNLRVLWFNTPAATKYGQLPAGVVGQSSMNQALQGCTASQISSVSGLAIETLAGSSAYHLWICDGNNNRVLRFTNAAFLPTNSAVASLVLGQPNFTSNTNGSSLSQLWNPGRISISPPQGILPARLWVSDTKNHRMLSWSQLGAKANGAVAGTSFSVVSPSVIHAESQSRLWVANSNACFSRFDSPALLSGIPEPTAFLGTPAKWDQPSTLNVRIRIHPTTGQIFVCDSLRNRVVRYSNAEAVAAGNPEAVLGQPDMFTVLNNPSDLVTSNRFNTPKNLCIDSQGWLWVADAQNNRVLGFENAATFTNFASASIVLGQADFTSKTSDLDQWHLNYPTDVAEDSAGRLWVSDYNNARLVRFDARVSGVPASRVLGQTNLVSAIVGPMPPGQRILSPSSLEYENGRLWVVAAKAILRFENVDGKNGIVGADGLLGQTNFTTQSYDLAPNITATPEDITVNAKGSLWVADSYHHRILRFDNAAAKPASAPADAVMGQTNLTSNVARLDLPFLFRPCGMALDAEGNVWTTSFRRIFRFSEHHPDIVQCSRANSLFTLKFTSVPGISYKIQTSTNLVDWVTQPSTIKPATTETTWILPASESQKFFRVMELP